MVIWLFTNPRTLDEYVPHQYLSANFIYDKMVQFKKKDKMTMFQLLKEYQDI